MAQGKRVVLKDQVHVTTVELYEKLRAAEKATKSKKRSSGRGKSGNTLEAEQNNIDNTEELMEDS